MKGCRLLQAIAVASLLLLQGCGSSGSSPLSAGTGGGTKTPTLHFETVYHDVIPLPAQVEPWAPTWAPDGQHVVFNNIVDGTEWIAAPDGSKTSCLSCAMSDVAKRGGEPRRRAQDCHILDL